MTRRYFILSNSFAAPFFSDEGSSFIEAETPQDALVQYAAAYSHPCKLYSAAAYASADAYHEKCKPLARWLCNHEIEKQRLTADLGGYSYLGNGAGDFEIDGKRHVIENPYGGRVLEEEPA